MAISSETLFHFTDSADKLIGILTNEFLPAFCLENFNILSPFKMKKDMLEYAIPMVSFCDLPLSNIEKHLKFYGEYGIGLRKDWGIRNGLNPIVYLSHESFFKFNLTEVLGIGKRNNRNEAELNKIIQLINFIKPYEGNIYRKDRYYTKKFYDEREWRYVPDLYKLIDLKKDNVCD